MTGMIRAVVGNADGRRTSAHLHVPHEDPAVVEAFARCWGELAGWTDVVVRTPSRGTLEVVKITYVPTVERLYGLLACWQQAVRPV